MKDTFNSEFYVTTATVIPVLFLAVAVQASAIVTNLTRLDHIIKTKSKSRSAHFWLVLSGVMAIQITWMIGILVMIFGISGEITSLMALYHRSDHENTRSGVLI
jgi:formate-dependent nitrite reductase membrane component NrfD